MLEEEGCDHQFTNEVRVADKLLQDAIVGHLTLEVRCGKCDAKGLVSIRVVDVIWEEDDGSSRNP